MDGFNFDAILARLDDQREISAQRHAENVGRLQRIEEEVRRTNGRVTRNELQIKRLEDDGRDNANAGDNGEEVTLGRLKWYLVCVGAGAAGMVWLLKLIGKL